MFVYNILGTETVGDKLNQLRSIGLSNSELSNLSEIVDDSYKAVAGSSFTNSTLFTNNMNISNFTPALPAPQIVP